MRKKHVGVGLAPTLLLLAMFTIMITACTSGTTAGSSNSPNTVQMDSTTFAPSSITIKKGESLTLANTSSAVHTIENGTWDGDGTARANREDGALKVDVTMKGGETQTFGPFNTAGTFQLYCTLHSDMNLTVTVK